MAISSNGWPFLGMDGHFLEWRAILTDGWPFLAMEGCFWQGWPFWEWKAISSSGWLFLAMDGYFWQWRVILIYSNGCPFLGIDGHFRAGMAKHNSSEKKYLVYLYQNCGKVATM